jgi:hypothetical protein
VKRTRAARAAARRRAALGGRRARPRQTSLSRVRAALAARRLPLHPLLGSVAHPPACSEPALAERACSELSRNLRGTFAEPSRNLPLVSAPARAGHARTAARLGRHAAAAAARRRAGRPRHDADGCVTPVTPVTPITPVTASPPTPTALRDGRGRVPPCAGALPRRGSGLTKERTRPRRPARARPARRRLRSAPQASRSSPPRPSAPGSSISLSTPLRSSAPPRPRRPRSPPRARAAAGLAARRASGRGSSGRWRGRGPAAPSSSTRCEGVRLCASVCLCLRLCVRLSV